MNQARRIERALRASVDACCAGAPPRLAAALRHAVFPGGARIRPRLCLAVAAACGDPLPGLTDAVAAAVEMIHCASLVHDDLPCFDNASTRRGLPAVHRAYGEPLAVLAGDALIVAAFDTVARAGVAAPDRVGRLIEVIARGVSAPHGIIAGQAWESEPHIPVITYRRAKTAALFEAAAAAGAVVAGDDPAAWRAFGERIGEAYQVADDIHDVSGDPTALGKPIGRDALLGRPNAAHDSRGLRLARAARAARARGAPGDAFVPEARGDPRLGGRHGGPAHGRGRAGPRGGDRAGGARRSRGAAGVARAARGPPQRAHGRLARMSGPGAVMRGSPPSRHTRRPGDGATSMGSTRRLLSFIVGAAACMIVGAACGSAETSATTGGDTTSSSSGTATSSSTTVSSSGTGGTGGMGTGGTGGMGTGGAATVKHGPAASDLVNSGDVVKSPGYKMVFTLGQPTQNQSTTKSPGYRMQGGLVGANGTLP
ncbi:MAG: polyprenyl synthetase family protein [Minicystis sp.]